MFYETRLSSERELNNVKSITPGLSSVFGDETKKLEKNTGGVVTTKEDEEYMAKRKAGYMPSKKEIRQRRKKAKAKIDAANEAQ